LSFRGADGKDGLKAFALQFFCQREKALGEPASLGHAAGGLDNDALVIFSMDEGGRGSDAIVFGNGL
jgi:hypothetical protein